MSLFVFAPPPFSYLAATAFLLLMLLILGTGNYCFFNLLGIALALLLIDDAIWQPLFARLWPRVDFAANAPGPIRWPVWMTVLIALVIAVLSGEVLCRLFRFTTRWPKPVEQLMEWLEPFRLVNSYGLFAVMTTERPEIIVEGSDDGVHWRAYEFKWKPGGMTRRPRFVAPHQPRLDWQMWFAALSYFPSTPWFRPFLIRLLRNSPDVLALLQTSPFAEKPPRFVRAALYSYRFADRATRRATGAWWQRERRGLYSPELSLRGQSDEQRMPLEGEGR